MFHRDLDADRLHRMYVEEGLSPRAIGQLVGLGETAVRKRLLALGIPLRTRSEAQRNARGLGLTREILEQLYWVEGLSQPQIAARLHCSTDAVRDAMRRLGIATRSGSTAAQLARGVAIPETDLRRLYLEERLSAQVIAAHYRCSQSAVRNRLRAYGISRRTPWAHNAVTIGAEVLQTLYVEQGKTVEALAKAFRCSPATISRQLKRHGIPARSPGVVKYPRHDFSGNLVEKGYLIGFRLGDLSILREGNTVVVSTSTTKPAQLDLLIQLFGAYGHYSIYRHSSGRSHFQCRLNDTFAFLIEKSDRVPDWVLADAEAFWGFMAGYLDAEGSFQVRSTSPRLSLRSYDQHILRAIWQFLQQQGIAAPEPRMIVRAGYQNAAGITSRRDTWALTVHRRRSLAVLIDKLKAYLRHAKRRADADLVLAAVLAAR